MPCLPAQVYNPYLLINKKRYAGLLWTSPDHWDKMDTKVWPHLPPQCCSSAVSSYCLNLLLEVKRQACELIPTLHRVVFC